MTLLRDWINRARQDFSQNPRLRIGVVVIAAILALYAFLVLRDWRADLHDNYVERRQHLHKINALAGQNAWPARAEAMSRLRKSLEAQIPAATSQGLAQAGAQTWLRDLTAVHAGAVQVLAQPPQAGEGQAGLWRIPIVISGALPPRAVLNIIQQVEKRSSLSVIEESMILNRENKTIELTVVSYARVAGGSDDAAR